ncbi:hypothetical protein C8Q75DRAFT_744137 [Abortiporus biennis]|nr:hypothetical protein C8Q75DRAFT_744137 [Abortiporus biennis]
MDDQYAELFNNITASCQNVTIKLCSALELEEFLDTKEDLDQRLIRFHNLYQHLAHNASIYDDPNVIEHFRKRLSKAIDGCMKVAEYSKDFMNDFQRAIRNLESTELQPEEKIAGFRGWKLNEQMEQENLKLIEELREETRSICDDLLETYQGKISKATLSEGPSGRIPDTDFGLEGLVLPAVMNAYDENKYHIYEKLTTAIPSILEYLDLKSGVLHHFLEVFPKSVLSIMVDSTTSIEKYSSFRQVFQTAQVTCEELLTEKRKLYERIQALEKLYVSNGDTTFISLILDHTSAQINDFMEVFLKFTNFTGVLQTEQKVILKYIEHGFTSQDSGFQARVGLVRRLLTFSLTLLDLLVRITDM